MGIGGHILGERKLRRLTARTGLPLDRAYRRGRECEGRVTTAAGCYHWSIDWETGTATMLPEQRVTHWASCPPKGDR